MRFLTGIKPTGQLHLGNYVGAMRPFLAMMEDPKAEAFLMIADGHALTACKEGEVLRGQTRHIAAAWLALGLDPERVTFYRQSHVREVFELFWILCCVCPKGLMNRAHAYKAAIEASKAKSEEDAGILMGLYNYPILMAADILLFDAERVPVGKDQIQHVEIARDLTLKVNQTYGSSVLKLPEALVSEKTPVISGLDGRKMSKSYHNTVPLFASDDEWKKLIFRIKTTSQRPEEPKDTDNCLLFSLYSLFKEERDRDAMKERYQSGIGWAEMKQLTFEAVRKALSPLRERYREMISDEQTLDEALAAGEEKASCVAQKTMKRMRDAVGF